jgi:pimeloyl-ACP methyl ester carboxylesterase
VADSEQVTARITTTVGPLVVRSRGRGPVAVLWHSLFVDDRSWARVEDDLARERRLVIITGPGHGASGDPGRRYSLDDCAVAAAEVLNAVEAPGAVDWVGNAWGGHVGIVFAARWPERCRTLITLGTPVEAYTPPERRRTQLLLALYRAFGAAPFICAAVRDVLLSPRTRDRDPEAGDLVIDSLRRADRRRMANAIISISIQREDLTPRLRGLQCPALLITGSDHPGWTPAQNKRASGLAPRGSSAVVPDAAYLVPLEDPASTVQLVRGFWGADDAATDSRATPGTSEALVASRVAATSQPSARPR